MNKRNKQNRMELKFSEANTKLEKLYKVGELDKYLRSGRFTARVYSLDLLSGWSCPFAKDCHSKVVELGPISKAGNPKVKIQDGKDTQFRCFSASQEALLPNVYAKRKRNYELLKQCKTEEEMADLIERTLPRDAGIVRIHVGGDMFTLTYFRAWLEVARRNPDVLFYAYTKSLSYWVAERDNIPQNLILTASRGGRQDDLIDKHNLREAVVVFSEQEAAAKGLEIDWTDEHAARPDMADQSFALLIHGVQPKGTEANEALQTIKATKRALAK